MRTGPQRLRLRTGSRRLTVVMAAAALSACRVAGVLNPQGPVSSAELLILLDATGIMLVVVAPVIVLTLAFAWWYRATNRRATYLPEWEYSGQIELVVWSIPTMVVLLLAGVTWISSHDLDPAVKLDAAAKPLHIEVVSLDWKWLFIYPDRQVASINELVVPIGTPLEFTLTSATVMNAFFVPQLGSQIYTMPGMTTHLNLLADHPGDYPGLSSHFSGEGFSDMRFVVRAVESSHFNRWVAAARSDMPALSEAVYDEMARPSSNVPIATYGSVEPMLYQYILRNAAPVAAPKDP